MINDLFLIQEYVTVAVALDDRSRGLAKYAADLAKHLGKKLCLVHVLEPYYAAAMAQPFGMPSPIYNELPAIKEAATLSAEAKLRELKVEIEGAFSLAAVRTEVRDGQATEAILKCATDVGTCLLVAGGGFKDVKFFPAGLHTSLALANSAPMPVLVVDPKVTPSPARFDQLRILLADDLEPKSDAAIRFAASIAQAYRGSWLYHVHVDALTKDFLKFGLESAASAAWTLMSQRELDSIADAVETAHKRRVEERFAPYLEYLEASTGKYTADVVAGSARSQLSWVSQEFEPDLLVFGRHAALHHKPFALGRMPYREMLRLQRPMIVVPNI